VPQGRPPPSRYWPSTHKRSGAQLFFVHGRSDGLVNSRMASEPVRRYGSGSAAWCSSGNHLDAQIVKDAGTLIASLG
jgi:hypothetical protein